jgi:hypothetical protein
VSGRTVLVVNATTPVPAVMQQPEARVEIRVIFPAGTDRQDLVNLLWIARDKAVRVVFDHYTEPTS